MRMALPLPNSLHISSVNLVESQVFFVYDVAIVGSLIAKKVENYSSSEQNESTRVV